MRLTESFSEYTGLLLDGVSSSYFAEGLLWGQVVRSYYSERRF